MNTEINSKSDRLSILAEFNAATDDTWFGQLTVAAVRHCSPSTIERDRWAGIGGSFCKVR